MKKMNNKGFAVSTMLYGLLIVIVLVMGMIISIMAFNRKNSKEFTQTVVDELEKNITTPVTVQTPYSTKRHYESIGDAVADAPEGSKIIVQSDITETNTINIGKNIAEINLGTKTINGCISIASGSKVKISNGSIDCNGSEPTIYNNGELTITDGTYTYSGSSSNSLFNDSDGRCTIENGNFSNTIGWTIRNKGSLNIKKANIKLTKEGTDGTALYNDEGGRIKTEGGTIESTGYGFVNNSTLGTDDSAKANIENMTIQITSNSGFYAVLNRNNSYTYLINNTIKATRTGYPILNNQGGNLVSYKDKIDEFPISGVVYRYYEFGPGDVEVAVFGRSDITSFPTWSNANGQDDLKWYSATDYSNGYGSYKFVRIYASNHNNERGKTYTTHIYAGSTYVFGFSYTMP